MNTINNINQLLETKEKTKQTNLEKYGVDHHSQTDEWKEKIKKLRDMKK